MDGTGPAGIRKRRWLSLCWLFAALLLLGGCLQDAEDQCFTFDNANDPQASSACTGGEPADSGTSSSNIALIVVTTVSEVAVIGNSGTADEDLTGWTLNNETSGLAADVFTFPAFILPVSGFVRVHSAAAAGSMVDDADDLYWDGSDNHWDVGESVVLKDELAIAVATCTIGTSC